MLVCLNMSFHDDVTRAERMVSTMQFDQGRADVSASGIMSRPTVLNLHTENQRVVTNANEGDGDVKPGEVDGDGSYELARFRPDVWGDAENSGATTSNPKSTTSTKGDILV